MGIAVDMTALRKYRQHGNSAAGVGYVLEPALRTGAPYLARHLGWYEDSAHPSDELLHYRAHADPLTTNWEGERAPAWKLKALLDRMRTGD